MFGIGPQELLIILVIALVVVGPRKLPEMARSIGKGLREVRKAQDEVRKTIQVDLDEEPSPPRKAGPSPAPRTTDEVAAPDGAEPGGSGSDLAAAGAAAGATTGADPVADVSRSLGRGLAELRKAREEIQRTFRVDLGEVTGTAPPRRPASQSRPSPATPAEAPGTTGEPGAEATEASAGSTEEPVPGPQAPAAE